MFIEVAKEVFIDPAEVASVERDTVYNSNSPSGTNIYVNFDGSRIILKNGRKIFINKVMPNEVMAKLGLIK